MDDAEFLRRFEAGDWPHADWHHREHVKIAYLYLRRYPLEEAINQIRAGIKRLNAVHKTPEAIDRGYHETMTQAWMRLVFFTLCEYGPTETADKFFDDHPQLWQMKTLRFFYSRDRLMSSDAKAMFVEPDLTPLPRRKH
jgi:hypothetical protein